MNPFSTLIELSAALARREVGALEVTDFYLARIARADAKLNAFVAVDEELAHRYARAADERRAGGLTLGPLDGVPVALKDLLDIAGRVTTAGSALFRERRSPFTATAVERLLAAGVVPLGKTQMVEFAFGTWGINPHLDTPWNPWDLSTHRIPGGSSSGSGVAVAAGLAPAAIGSDTGGSVRIPAALNGITGLKTTVGRVSTSGAFPLSTTLDTIGPMTRSSEDAALLTAALAGAPAVAESAADGALPLAGTRIALLAAEQYPIAVEPAVSDAIAAARSALRALGAQVAERSFPFDFGEIARRYLQIVASEAYAVHRAHLEDERLPIGAAVRARVLGGKAVSAADYIDALAFRARACAQWRGWMRDADALLTPTLPMIACAVSAVDESLSPLASFTRLGNFVDACGLSLPAGFSREGLPVAVQLLGKPFDEAVLLRVGRAFQQATDWHRRTPDLTPLSG